MTYVNTYTPRVAMPRSDARVTAMPKTEADYIKALDALCRKEGRKGSVPSQQARPPRADHAGRANLIMEALRREPLTKPDMRAATGLGINAVETTLDNLKTRGEVMFCRKINKWKVTE